MLLNLALKLLQLGLIYTALEIASASVRSGDCMSAFIFLNSGSNSWVGYVQGVNGIMQVREMLTKYSNPVIPSLIMQVILTWADTDGEQLLASISSIDINGSWRPYIW